MFLTHSKNSKNTNERFKFVYEKQLVLRPKVFNEEMLLHKSISFQKSSQIQVI